ncbi:hypothetical protein MaudCBS49596_004196 [Microsporum audouinii]
MVFRPSALTILIGMAARYLVSTTQALNGLAFTILLRNCTLGSVPAIALQQRSSTRLWRSSNGVLVRIYIQKLVPGPNQTPQAKIMEVKSAMRQGGIPLERQPEASSLHSILRSASHSKGALYDDAGCNSLRVHLRRQKPVGR